MYIYIYVCVRWASEWFHRMPRDNVSVGRFRFVGLSLGVTSTQFTCDACSKVLRRVVWQRRDSTAVCSVNRIGQYVELFVDCWSDSCRGERLCGRAGFADLMRLKFHTWFTTNACLWLTGKLLESPCPVQHDCPWEEFCAERA